MSSQPQKRSGTPPTGRAALEAPPITAVAELSRKEKNALYRLKYNNQDILALGVYQCRRIIDAKLAKGAPVTLPGEDAARRALTDERLAARDADAPKATAGLEMGRDELAGRMLDASENRHVKASEFAVTEKYDGRVIEGDDYVSAAINLFANNLANSEYLFRVIDRNRPQENPGPEWKLWHGADGKTFKVGDGEMAYMPKDVHKRAYTDPFRKTSDLMTSAISNNPNDADLRMNDQDAQIAPILRRTIGPEGEIHNAGAFETPAHPKTFIDRPTPGAA